MAISDKRKQSLYFPEEMLNEIQKEEADYKNYPIPKFYTFPSDDARERILYQNFVSVNKDVKDMIKTILMFKVKS